MTCHPPKENFTPRGKSRRKDRAETLYTCKQCGETWQHSESGWYQVKPRKYKTKLVMLTARVPESILDELREYIKKRKTEYLK